MFLLSWVLTGLEDIQKPPTHFHIETHFVENLWQIVLCVYDLRCSMAIRL